MTERQRETQRDTETGTETGTEKEAGKTYNMYTLDVLVCLQD